MAGIARKCPCLRPKIDDDVKVLDYRHSSLQDVPNDVFNKERTLEELCVDSNQIRDLPRELFFCHGLRKLTISDNELTSIPVAISSLTNLEELDFSKNGIIDVPDSIKGCKYLRSIDASVNPLGKFPEGFTYLANLTHLYLNDTYLEYLPGSFGRMVKLKILELRENNIKALPRSVSRLTDLERLDIGNNEFTELTDVLGALSSLLELWCDNNQITTITRSIGRLKHLMYLDASNNQLQELPKEIDGCVSLADLHLTSNNLMELPDTIGHLGNLITLKIDDNQLVYLPRTLGGLSSLSELNVSANDLEDLPASIGLLRNLRTFYADENLLQFLPAEIGSCSGITVLSLRCNKLTYIPDELGRIPRLRVLNLSDNHLRHLPFSIVKLKELQALWLTENQTRPLIPLQSDYETETGRKILTCYLLPQGGLKSNDERKYTGDSESFHASMWDEERLSRQQIHFAFTDDSDEEGTLVRCPTPYPKELKQKVRHSHSLTMKQVIRAGSGSKTSEDALDRPGVTDHISEISGSNDEEKLLKDKVHTQHRLSMPDFDSGLNGYLKDVQNASKIIKTGDAKSSGRSGSVPDLTFSDDKEIPSTTRSLGRSILSASSKHDDLYNKQIAYRHKVRRSRQLRDYDSDTDYRSEYEVLRFRQEVRDNSSLGTNLEILSVQSQPLPHYYHHDQISGRWGDAKRCTSDLKGYSGGGSFPTANAAAAAFQRKYRQANQFQDQNILYASRLRAGTPDSSQNFRPDSSLNSELYNCNPRQSSDFRSQYMGVGDKESPRTRSNRSLNNTVTGNLSVQGSTGNIVSNDVLYKILPTGEYDSTFQAKTKNLATTNNNHYSSNQQSLGFVHKSTTETLFQPHLTTGPTIQIPTNSELPSQKQFASSEKAICQNQQIVVTDRSNINGNLSGSNLSLQHSHHSATPSPPALHKDTFVDLSMAPIYEVPHPLTETAGSLSLAAVQDCNGKKLCTVLEERSASLKHLYSDQSVSPRQSPTIPPPYNPAPPYRRSSANSGLGPCINRLSSDSSSSHADSPQSATNMHDTVVEATSLAMQNIIVNRSESSPCGFHGSSPYHDLPATPKEKLSFTNYADIDRRKRNRNYGRDYYRRYRDHHTSRSSSSSSQIGSASQIRPSYPLDIDAREHSQSDSSDSQSDVHNHFSSLESPHSGRVSGSPQPSSGEDQAHDHCSHSFDVGNYDELSMIPNQEQSSQISSSTDSGYSHGHHVYERIGDHSRTKCEKYSSLEGQCSKELASTSTVSSQRQASTKTPGKNRSRRGLTADSTTQEIKDQFRITIKKNPGLGFSIAGGIGSHGNPFREKDIGIFVTKVVPDGPASKFLQPGDKIIEVNKVDFQVIDHNQAVAVLKKNNIVTLLIERIQKVNVV